MADQSITDYTAATALARADLVEVVQDVATTPVNKKATLDVLDPGNTLGGDGSATAGSGTPVAVGPGSIAFDDGVVVGDNAETTMADSVAIGLNASAKYRSVAIGSSANATAGGLTNEAIAIGHSASGEDEAIAIGNSADCTAANSVALGHSATAGHSGSVALGRNTSTTATDQVMVGPRDIEITGTVKGLVLEDRTLATRHRVYLDNGTLSIEAA